MSLKWFSFIFIIIKFSFAKSKLMSHKILSFSLNYRHSQYLSLGFTEFMFYLFLCIVIICLITYIIAIKKRLFIKYHILIILGLLLQLLRVWIIYLGANDSLEKLRIFDDKGTNYHIISIFNKYFILIINLILMNFYPILNCFILIFILAHFYKPYLYGVTESEYFYGKYRKSMETGEYIFCSVVNLLIIGCYFICFNKIRKIYNRFIRNIENPIITKKYHIIRIIFCEVIFYELTSAITFFIFCTSEDGNYYYLTFSMYYYSDVCLIMSYFIFYFPTMTFWQNRTNIIDHMIWEAFRGFGIDILLIGEINFENSIYLMNVYELDTENINEDEFFENIDNDSYIIIDNPYLSEKNNDMNELISNNFYYENILVGYVKNEIK